ncbi:thioredoxin family protein [Nocardia sp. NPDC057353]|uniref:thioredoxin family protein n=1 Tax=Nocardia sp. NPDC057353 TaxID=3346104 RepID=UPI00363283B9
MPTQAFTQRSFEQAVSGGGIVLVDYWASWCSWCTRFAPVFEESSNQHRDIVHATVDTEAEAALTAAAQVKALPTLHVYREGLLVYANAGFHTAAQLEEVVQHVMWLDMEAVRREMGVPAPDPGGAQAKPPAVAERQAGLAAGPTPYGWPGLRAR